MSAAPTLVSPFRTDKTSISDHTISLIGVFSGVVLVHRTTTMSLLSLIKSSQLVNDETYTANAAVTATKNAVIVVNACIFIL